MFLPTTKAEMRGLGWDACDIIIITGDTYIDSPFIGAAVIGNWLTAHGFRVGVIAQPDTGSDDIARLGEPLLYWGVTAGSLDSLVANKTAAGKWRQSDDLTPGGVNNRRPNRASLVYTNLIRRFFKPTVPIVLGGIEASLRRIAHYDYWTDKIRKSILFNAKADYLVYGMGERAALAFARALQRGETPGAVPGSCLISAAPLNGYVTLPSFEEAAASGEAFSSMFRLFYENQEPLTARGLQQRQDSRWLIHHPPGPALSSAQLDAIHDAAYTRRVHPFYHKQGEVRAQDTIRFSLLSHRGCYGECNFCSIAVHQGRRVVSRSEASILKEARALTKDPDFKWIISDTGGPTANMYGSLCRRMDTAGACSDKRCLFPEVCGQLRQDHARQLKLLRQLRGLPGVRKVFVASGIRYDLITADRSGGEAYLTGLVEHHVSGQLKIAPEHTDRGVLRLMGKPGRDVLLRFLDMFRRIERAAGSRRYLSCYFIAAHPGCAADEMRRLAYFVKKELGITPRQVQVFTPLPSTWSAVMYHTGIDPFSGERIFVEKSARGKQRQKDILTKNSGRQRTGIHKEQ